jgi:hypothetical protein
MGLNLHIPLPGPFTYSVRLSPRRGSLRRASRDLAKALEPAHAPAARKPRPESPHKAAKRLATEFAEMEARHEAERARYRAAGIEI